MNENKKEKTIDIIIPAGYRSFKEKLDIHLNKGLNVITGINGSGKTQLLEYIYFKEAQNNKEEIFLRRNNNFDYIKTRFSMRDRIYSRFDENDDRNINDILNRIEKEYEDCIYAFGLTQIYIYPGAFYNAIFVKDNFLYHYINSKKSIILRNNEKEISFKINFLKRIIKIISKNTHEPEEKIAKNFGVISDYDLRYKLQEKFIKEEKIFKNRRDKEIENYTDEYIKNPEHYEKIVKIEEEYFEKHNTIKSKMDFINYIDYLLTPLNNMDGIIIKLSNIIYNDAVKRAKHVRTKKIWEQINEILDKYDNFNYNLEEPDLRIDYKISFKYKNNKNPKESIPFENLSSGEKIIFELICYIFITDYNNNKYNKTKIILLDEFDANLNPELSELLIKTIRDELVKRSITVVLTTHSPSTVALVEPRELHSIKKDKYEKHIFESAKDENDKKEILEKLAPKFVYEKELGFMGILAKTPKKYIVFVEGKSDEIHFNIARQYLNPDDDNYEFIECGCASRVINLLKVIKDIELFDRLLKNKIIIGLCDFDNEPCVQISELIDRNYKSQINNNSLQKYCQKIHDKINGNGELIFDIENKNNTNLNIKLIMLTPDKCSNFWKTKNFDLEHMYNIEKYQNDRKQEINIMKKKNKTDLNNLNCEEIDDIKYDNISFESNPEYYDTCLDSDGKIKFAEYVSKNPQKFKEAFETNFKRIFDIIKAI